MGDAFSSSPSSSNAASDRSHRRALPQPSVLVEDEDEPPSRTSNASSGQAQVDNNSAANVNTTSLSHDIVYTVRDETAVTHSRDVAEKFDPAVTLKINGRQDTFDDNDTVTNGDKDLEQGPRYTSQYRTVTTRRKKPYRTIFGVRLPLRGRGSRVPGKDRNGTAANKLRTLFTPTRPLGPPPTYTASLLSVLRYSPLNICLLFIPVSWALHFTHQSPTLTFVFSALGILPLAALLGFGTEQIALRTSASVGGLLNATLGNIVEMIIAGIALKKCELELVQSSLLGGLLSNLLLVLGMAFIVGGYRFQEQEFRGVVAQLNSSLLMMSVIALIVPAAFHGFLGESLRPGTELRILLQFSRGSAIILIFIYFAYLYFQFYSHNHLFLEVDKYSSTTSRSSSELKPSTESGSETMSIPSSSSSSSHESEEDDFHTIKLNTSTAVLLVLSTTGLAYLTAESLVSSLNGLLLSHPSISREFITLIIIPVISNAAEHITAVIVASKGKFDLAMSVAVGSCIQIALFVVPVLVLVAWGMGKPLTLLVDEVEMVVLFLAVLLVKFCVEDGKSHWLSGLVLVAVYMLLALLFWHFPETHRIVQGNMISCT